MSDELKNYLDNINYEIETSDIELEKLDLGLSAKSWKELLEYLDTSQDREDYIGHLEELCNKYEEEIERLNNIINELEKDMREKYHKEIDYQSKIMQSDLMQGDYPVSYYAEQNEKLLNYYLNKLKELKGV